MRVVVETRSAFRSGLCSWYRNFCWTVRKPIVSSIPGRTASHFKLTAGRPKNVAFVAFVALSVRLTLVPDDFVSELQVLPMRKIFDEMR